MITNKIYPLDLKITYELKNIFASNRYKNIFIFISMLASKQVTLLWTVIIIAYLIRKRFWYNLLQFSFDIVICGGAITFLLKHIIQRERPIGHLDDGFSFPSGHSVRAILIYGYVYLLLLYVMKNKPVMKNKIVKYSLFIIIFIVVISIGISRITLGAHYPSDVLGGYLLGLSFLLLSDYYKKLIQNQPTYFS